MEFPEIPDDAVQQLGMVAAIVREDPSVLDSEDFPYPDWMKELFRPRGNGSSSSEQVGDDVDLRAEILGLMKKLEEFGEGLSSEDTKELNTFFRVKTTLLEKLTTLRERAENVARIAEFKSAVLEILDDEMDKDQRARVLNRLKGLT
jgi:hypothetical protein